METGTLYKSPSSSMPTGRLTVKHLPVHCCPKVTLPQTAEGGFLSLLGVCKLQYRHLNPS